MNVDKTSDPPNFFLAGIGSMLVLASIYLCYSSFKPIPLPLQTEDLDPFYAIPPRYLLEKKSMYNGQSVIVGPLRAIRNNLEMGMILCEGVGDQKEARIYLDYRNSYDDTWNAVSAGQTFPAVEGIFVKSYPSLIVDDRGDPNQP